MFDNKSAIFIDTNVFESLGFNFDEENKILKQFKKLLDTGKYEHISISVIDNEIKNHINKRIKDSKKELKKYWKWLVKTCGETKIEEYLNKDLNDYQKFKLETNTKDIDLRNINPELVMEKYFELQPPFENKKQNEFKDAFFLEGIYDFANSHEDYLSFIVITNDKGVIKAIENQNNKKIVYFNTIQDFIDSLIEYNIDNKIVLFDYISTYNFNAQIAEKAKINIMNIEEEEIDIDKYSCDGIFFPKVIKKTSQKVTVVCDMYINLIGKFKCLDYDMSYYSNEESDYLYKEYKERNFLGFVCQTVIEVEIENGEYVSAIIVDLPEIDITYDSFQSLEEYIEQEKYS